MRRHVDALVPGLAGWLTGGSFYAQRDARNARDVRHPDRHALWGPLDAVLRFRTGPLASAVVADAASVVLEAGLEQRAGAYGGVLALTAGELRTYRALLALGAKHPARVAVCEDCRIVFRPARKGRAFKCPRCHASPRPATPAPRGRTPEAIARARAEGWVPFRATVARETFDAAGEAVGWRSVTVAPCEVCGEQMEGREHAKTCSPTCRSRRHRSALLQARRVA